VVVCPGDHDKTTGADKAFIPEKMISTPMAKPGEEETYKIIPQII
jgi:hypothetical protein